MNATRKVSARQALARQYRHDEPKPVTSRSGCKVGWWYYDNEADAKLASEVARHNANIDAQLGYDFGYCAPGSIRLMAPDAKYYEGEYGGVKRYFECGGLYEVCHS